MSEIAIPDTLSYDEKHELEALETRIGKGLQTFFDVGDALMAVRDGKLYREKHKTFEDYCQQKWQIKRSYADKLISSAETMSDLRTIVPKTELPKNEGQVRALKQFDEELRPVIIRQANGYSRATGKPVTAGMFERIGNVLLESEFTGHVDTGSGEGTALFAAISVAEAEATKRQNQKQQEHYDTHDSQGHVRPEERERREEAAKQPPGPTQPTFAKPTPQHRPKPERVYVDPDDLESFRTVCQNLIDCVADYPDGWNAFIKGEFRKSLEQVNLIGERFLA